MRKIDAVIEAIDRRRAELAAENTLKLAYEGALRVLSRKQAATVIKRVDQDFTTRKRRIGIVSFYQRPRQHLSEQELVEIGLAVFGDHDHEEEGRE